MIVEPFTPCRKCCKSPQPGFLVSGFGMVECDCHKNWKKREGDHLAFVQGGFNASLWSLEDDYYRGNNPNHTRLQNFVKLFPENKEVRHCWIYIYGPNNTQKTTTANWIGKKIIQAGYKAEYLLMKDLLDILTDTMRDENDSRARVKQLQSRDLLVIDEAFAKDKLHLWQSGIQIGYIDSFLRECYSKGVCIIFISNIEIKDIESQGFSHSIASLVERTIKPAENDLLFDESYDAPPRRLF